MRKSGLELSTALAVASVIAAGTIAWFYGLPLRDPDGSTGATYIRLPIIVGIVLLVDVIPRILVRAWRWRVLWPALASVVQERWTAANLRFTFVGLAGWYATYAAVRNLKAYVPFVNGTLHDVELDRLDRALFLGHEPSDVLHQLLGTGIAAHVLSFSYLFWIAALPASLAIALVWIRRARVSSWWVTAVSVDWALGVMLNFALPTLGPIYERPADFAALATTKTAALQDKMWDERVLMLADPANSPAVQNIAAFASLHVAIAATAVIVARRAGLHSIIVWSLRVFLVLTMIGTVYFGWHYVSDVVVGLLMGMLGAWVAEKFAASGEDELEDDLEQVSSQPGSQVGAPDLAGSRSRE